MIMFLKELISKYGILFVPITFLLPISQNKLLNISPAYQPIQVIQQTVTPSPTLTPTPTETPTPSPTPKPTVTPKPTRTPTTPTVTPIPLSSEQLNGWFSTYSNQYGVERDRLWSIAVCESKLNPSARNGDYAGLFQFSQNTWQVTRKQMNLDSNPSLRFNPEEAIKTAAFKISTGGLFAWKNCVK